MTASRSITLKSLLEDVVVILFVVTLYNEKSVDRYHQGDEVEARQHLLIGFFVWKNRSTDL